MPVLRRNLPIPLYHQLKMVILREIEAGRWKPGDRIPTENELIARFRVSKITVRQALRELATLGYIRREQGRGTFVQRPPLEEGPRGLTSFTDEMQHHGLIATSQVLEQGLIAGPDDITAKLQLANAAPVFRLRRLRFADGEPMGLQTAYVPSALVPRIDEMPFTDVSLYQVLRSEYNLHPVTARETHIAVLVSSEEAGLLRIPPGSPALAAERMTYLADGTPLECVRSIMRGDRYKIVLDLASPVARGV
jgi:GntR family transcriptional regulator